MYHKAYPRHIILLLLLTLAAGLLWFTGSTLASDGRAVDLASFTVEPLADGSMRLHWETGSEQDTQSFQIIRAVYPATPTHPADLITMTYNSVPTQTVPGLGGPGTGANYTAFDVGVTQGVTYTYIIVEKDTNGFFHVQSSFAVTIQAGDIANADVVVTPASSDLQGTSSSPAAHVYTIKNNGNRFDTFKVSRISHQWMPGLSTVIFSLAPGATKTLTATVTPPAGLSPCASDTATLKVESLGVYNSADSETVTATTTNGATACVYLPIIINP